MNTVYIAYSKKTVRKSFVPKLHYALLLLPIYILYTHISFRKEHI